MVLFYYPHKHLTLLLFVIFIFQNFSCFPFLNQ
nr:MAG TPA: hypothetical protein [Caudoviricetes sp.]